MKLLYLLIILPLITIKVKGQEILASDSIEASITDFTKIKDFSAKHASVFGLKIGLKINEAKEIISAFDSFSLRLEQDRYNNFRYYLYEIHGKDSIKVPIGLCKWESASSGLSELILYEEAMDCLAGDIHKLFSAEALDSSADLSRNFLGNPTKVVVDLEIPSLGMKSTRYYYAKRSIIVIENRKPGETTYHLAFYKSLL
jgi:hypothetical protein